MLRPSPASGDTSWYAEGVWRNAIHRVVADDLSPGQAVDEAIARVSQILSE